MTATPRTYEILRRAVEEGTAYGYRRAHKHTEEPGEDTIRQEIETAIMAAIDYLLACLTAFDAATVTRDRWYGRSGLSGVARACDRADLVGEDEALRWLCGEAPKADTPEPALPPDLAGRARAAGLIRGDCHWLTPAGSMAAFISIGPDGGWESNNSPAPNPFRTEAEALDDWLTRSGYPAVPASPGCPVSADPVITELHQRALRAGLDLDATRPETWWAAGYHVMVCGPWWQEWDFTEHTEADYPTALRAFLDFACPGDTAPASWGGE